MGTAIIKTNNLSKTYKSRSSQTKALDKLNLEVKQGEIFGYLGPNGAGKTTTIKLLLDLIRPTQGNAQILGMDTQQQSVKVHKKVGFLPAELSLWKGRTSEQVVNYIASIHGDSKATVKEAHDIADRLQFDMKKKVRDYSSGNKRKLGLVLAMMHQPEILILDEPSSGLDPLMQQTFNQMMREYRDSGRTVFLSSHVLNEVQAICDRVGILRDGDLKAVESIDKLTNVEFRWVTLHFRDAVPTTWKGTLEKLDSVTDIEIAGKELSLRLNGDFDPILRAVGDGYVENIHIQDPTLEEIFLTYYGGNGKEVA